MAHRTDISIGLGSISSVIQYRGLHHSNIYGVLIEFSHSANRFFNISTISLLIFIGFGRKFCTVFICIDPKVYHNEIPWEEIRKIWTKISVAGLVKIQGHCSFVLSVKDLWITLCTSFLLLYSIIRQHFLSEQVARICGYREVRSSSSWIPSAFNAKVNIDYVASWTKFVHTLALTACALSCPLCTLFVADSFSLRSHSANWLRMVQVGGLWKPITAAA